MMPKALTGARLYGIILAAGLSSRMGGSSKALRSIGGSTMLALCAGALERGGADRILVMTGHQREAVNSAARGLSVETVHNPDFRQGMFSSICAAFSRVAQMKKQDGDGHPCALFLLPVDAPLVQAWSVRCLTDYWHTLEAADPKAAARAVLIPSFAGHSGHPPLIGCGHIEAILSSKDALSAQGGLRAYLASLLWDESRALFAKGVAPAPKWIEDGKDAPAPKDDGLPCPPIQAGPDFAFLPMPDAGVSGDLDRPDDCEKAVDFLSLTRNRTLPSPQECREWLLASCMGANKYRHSIWVAAGALTLGLGLKSAGKKVDLPLIAAGGLLHDLVRKCSLNDKKCKAHAWRAMDKLILRGWEETALVVGAHTVLPDSVLATLGLQMQDVQVMCRMHPKCPGGLNDELLFAPVPGNSVPHDHYAAASESLALACMAVYLSDKFFFMDRYVPMDERFDIVIERFNGDAEAIQAIMHRKETAKAVNAWLANIVGSRAEERLPHCRDYLYRLDAKRADIDRHEQLWLDYVVGLLRELEA